MKKIRWGIFLLICILAFSFCVSPTLFSSTEEQEAFDILCSADIFSDGPVSEDGSMSDEIVAFKTIYQSKNALYYSKMLEQHASPVGKLYALCAIYSLDQDLYHRISAKYEQTDTTILFMGGCIITAERFSNVMCFR